MATYAPGAPCWVDLGSPDPAASVAFYGGLFGWSAQIAPEPEARGYTTFLKDGKPVAAVGPLQTDQQPPAWVSYFATDDADAVAVAVRASGGAVIVEPLDVLGYGRMAVFHDPAGAVAAVWQAGSMSGAEVTGEAGALAWNELTTRDVDGSKEFYPAVFGWAARDVPFEDASYTLWEVDGQPVAGMMPMVGEQWPPDLPPHWMVYFAVDDTDAAAGRVAELGGQVSVPPTDTPAGRLAVVGDPHGAFFSIIRPDPAFRP